MLIDILRFEWRYHTRQPAFLAASILFFLSGFVLTGTGFGPQNVALTAPWLVMETLTFISLFSVFALAVFVSSAVIRDTEHRMEEIVFTTPVGRFHYLFGRFVGAFGAAFTSITLAPVGMLIASRMPWIDVERAGSIDLLAYLWPLAVMVVPTLLFATALLLLLATTTRSALATYTASVFIYLLYMAGAALTDSPIMAQSTPGAGGGLAAALLDPFGLSAFFEVTRYWTIAEKNSRFVALDGSLLLNRALWLVAAAGTWGLTWRRFTFRLLHRANAPASKRDTGPVQGMGDTGPVQAVMYARAEPAASGLRTALATWGSASRLEIAAALRSRPLLLLLALWFGLALMELRTDLFEGEYGSRFYPTTGLIVGGLAPALTLIGMLIVLYYGAELFWREQQSRMASILDATPVSGTVMVLAKWTAMAALVFVAITTGIAAGVVLQVTSGYYDLEPLLYLSLYYLIGLPLVLYAAAAVAVHALSPGKYAGLVLMLLFAIATRRAQLVGLEHPLFRFAGGPPVGYSAMYGLEHTVVPFTAFMIHWSVMAACFLAVGAVAWRKMREPAMVRMRTVARAARTTGRAPLAVLGLLLAATGGWIYYDTNVVRTYTGSNALLDWKADYEKRYRSISSTPQPRLLAMQSRVDLYPSDRRFRISGVYTLVNDTGQPIQTLYVATRRSAREVALSLPGGRQVDHDQRFGMFRFDLDQPLKPGDRAALRFDLTFEGGGTGEEGRAIVENGSIVMGYLFFPSLGYRRSYELTDPRERAKRGLGASSTPELDDLDTLSGQAESGDMQWIDFDTTVSTDPDQRVVAQGRLEREWSENGRRYFRFRSEAPTLNRLAYASARYAVARRMAGDVEVSLAYHPAHTTNVEAILDTAVRTLEYCDRAFGPYPYRHLRMLETPPSWSFGAYALPGLLLLHENRTFQVDARDPDRPDLLTRRVSHEVAHQWWGHRLVAANGAGASMLIESLAKYTEQLILEQKHGRDHTRMQRIYELDGYLSGRAGEEERERPLVAVGEQSYVYYGKGSMVFYAIRELLGEAALNTALRNLVAEKHPGSTATSLDLMRHLRAVSNEAQYALLQAWTQRIVLYDLELEAAEVRPLPDGRYEVKARIVAGRVEAAADGTEKEAPLEEEIEVALFRQEPGLELSEALITKASHRLRSGVNEVTMVVGEAPGYVSVDPWLLRIDRNRGDNGRAVSAVP